MALYGAKLPLITGSVGGLGGAGVYQPTYKLGRFFQHFSIKWSFGANYQTLTNFIYLMSLLILLKILSKFDSLGRSSIFLKIVEN